MEEKGHVVEILAEAKKAIKGSEVIQLKELSNQTIHTASITQDPDNIALAVILYALSKIIERRKYQDYPDWPKFEKNYTSALDNALLALKRNEMEVYRDQIGRVRDFIKNIGGHLKGYVEEVFRKAQINKGSRIYEHGISLEKTAKILGITIWELNSYVGQTGIADVNLAYTLDIKKRLKNAEEIFE